MKVFVLIVFFLASVVIFLGTAFSPIILSFWYGNFLWMFLYIIIAPALITQFIVFMGIFSFLDHMDWI